MSITIELTSEDLERLKEGAARFGRCSIVVNTTEGVPVYLAATGNHTKPRVRRARAGADLGEAPSEPAPAAGK
jgi:hypothetical protein